MDFPKKQQQCLIPKYLLQYLTSLQISHNDPTAPWGGGGGGGSYTAGDGIDITNDVISIDNTVALKTDIPSLTGYATETWVTNQGYLVQSDLTNYVTSTDLATELLDYAELSDLATVATTGDYDDLLNTPTIPDAVSGTNDGTNWTSLTIGSDTYGLASGGSTPSNMVTTDTIQTISGSKTFTGLTAFKGTYYDVYFGQSSGFSVSDKNNPVQEQMSIYPGYLSAYRDTGNTTLDGRIHLGNHYFNIYNSDTEYKIKLVNKGGATTYGEYTFKNKTGDVAITSEIPTATSDLTNDSGFITSSALTGYATESWVSNQGYSTFSGDYNDLTNKPTIPDAVSGTNDGTNWTSLTIGNTTKNIPSGGSTPTNMVTTDTNQDITGVKTFVGDKKIAFKQSTSSNVLGFTAYNQNGTEVGNLQIANRGTNGMYITLGNYSSQTTKAKVGFRLQPNNSSSSFNFVMPSGNQANFTSNTYSTSSDTTIPCAFTDGTTIVKADATGLVNISSISGGGGSTPSNMATTNTAQNITGVKTIYNTSNGHSDMYFKAPLNDNSSNTMGFSAFDSSDRQIGGLQIMNRTLQFNSDESSTYYYGTFLTNFRNNSNSLNTVTGFRVLPSDRYSGSYSINFVAPIGTQTDLYDIYKSNSNVNTVNLVAAITDGTNTVLANKLGVADISSLLSGGGTTVSGTNDGTNWTSLTINGTTKSIPSGGSGSSQLYVMVHVDGQDANYIGFDFTLIVDISNMTIIEAKELYNNNNDNYDFATSAATYPTNFNFGYINGQFQITSITYDSVNEIVTLNYNDGSPQTLTFSESNLINSFIESIANS